MEVSKQMENIRILAEYFGVDADAASCEWANFRNYT